MELTASTNSLPQFVPSYYDDGTTRLSSNLMNGYQSLILPPYAPIYVDGVTDNTHILPATVDTRLRILPVLSAGVPKLAAPKLFQAGHERKEHESMATKRIR